MGDEYLIGYRIAIQNSTLISDRVSISKSMTHCLGTKQESLFLPRKPSQTFQDLLINHEDEFIEFATQQTIKLQSQQNISNFGHLSSDSMTLPTRCYSVDFNDDSVTLSLLK